ncbi:DMT family transporter [Amorphus orientalis]|uniref:Drug/metabolite transporter (DMT)-like permease n=1 Tax=Amorphus orientalis TaxID=649198 RepID=A0AAE4AU99_9HYPH|nr:DMT family transporter [Amorphus orientalis]MDQ0317145.1 drug/metabolite transporter (DMT)-like permease [Amorphus orientalis]
MADGSPETGEAASGSSGGTDSQKGAAPQLGSLAGIGFKVLSALLFSGMLALVKLAGERLPVGEILFVRNVVGVIPVLVFVTWTGDLAGVLRTSQPFGHVKRAVIGTAAMGLWFASLTMLPLPDATAISYAAPLMLVALAALLLGEKVRIYRWSAVGVGFIGVLIILAPQVLGGTSPAADMQRTGSLLALAAAGCMALASVFVRELTATEQTGTIVIYFFMAAAVMSLVTAPFGWVVPTAFELALLLGIGLLGGIGQILLTQAYRFAEASTVAPFEYTTMIWMVLLGYFLFGEVPQPFVIGGTVIVIGAGLYVIYRERKLGLERRERAAASPTRP